MTKTVGIALGGGGAKGLAHIPVLEVLDEFGVDVVAVSGTSIGAIMGTLYASGMPATEIREALAKVLVLPSNLEQAIKSERLFGWLELLGLDFGKGYILEAETFLEEHEKLLPVANFEDLKIPTKVVAADFWERTEVILDKGPIRPAVAASFCLAGVFKPVMIDDYVLVDGGCVNPVPFDLIRKDCDILIAVDVLGKRKPTSEDRVPSYSDAIFNVFQIAERRIADLKRETHPPDIYLEPDILGVRVLEFHKHEEVIEQSKPELDRLRRELEVLLSE